MADDHDRCQRSAAHRDASIAQPQAGTDFAIMRAQLGCNPNTAQPQVGIALPRCRHGSAAATAHIVAGQTTSATKAQEATMEYATDTPYKGNATACSRCIIFYTCSVATRIDADQVRKCLRLAGTVHPAKATTAAGSRPTQASARFMCSNRAFQPRTCSNCAPV